MEIKKIESDELKEVGILTTSSSITVESFTGKQGPQGIQGPKGDTGPKGEDGVITESQIAQVTETVSQRISVPTKVSELQNDSGYLTQHQDISGKQDKITSSNKLAYSLISGTPTIPDISNLQTKITTSNKLDYSLLDNTPTIPDISNLQTKITTTNKLDYSLISGTPTIPTTLPASDVSLSNGTITIKGSTIKPLTSIPDTYATKTYVDDLIGDVENGTY